MAEKVKAIPDGYHSVTPYLIVDDAAGAIAFYQDVFNAGERMRMPGKDGRIAHAEITIGDSVIMLADESDEVAARSPRSIGGTPVSIALYVENVDDVVKKAVASGAKLERPVANQFYGDRTGGIQDPFGHRWYVATHVEDVSEEEMQRRMAALANA
jgi:PhnB protein